MEKYQHVFNSFIEFENLYGGYLLARRNKRLKPEILSYTANLEENLIDAQNHLIWKTLKVDGVHSFYEYFPKVRLIHSLPFKYRVINCAAYRVLWPIYSKSFYEHSYGSIPGRGALKAVQQLQSWQRLVLRKPDKWFIGKADISKFFFRVPVEVQLRELAKPLDDPDMMWFLETMIRADGRPFGLPLEVSSPLDAEMVSGVGMQVGSLISQMTANIVLTPLDHYIKRSLKAPYYIRYMDDMIVLAPSKQQVWDIIRYMDEYLRSNLGLQLNNKTMVIPADHGVEFVGRIVRPDRIDLRKSTSLMMKRHLNYVREKYADGEVDFDYARSVILSYLGILKWTSDTALRDAMLDSYRLIRKSDS